jgi:hypothetical protein
MNATLPLPLAERLDALARSLEARDDALALLALGSIGVEHQRADAWSDLDFFVIVKPGAKARYIERLDWLHAAHPVVWSYVNTRDGCKALMADGLFCEFAVFEPDELATIPYAPGRWVWRRDAAVPAALAQPRLPLPETHEPWWLAGEALGNLVVGLLRFHRGERLAAMRMVQVYALDRVLELLDAQGAHDGAPPVHARRDPFNVDRRAEARHPQEAAALRTWAGGIEHTPQAALALLARLEAMGLAPAPVAARIRELAG